MPMHITNKDKWITSIALGILFAIVASPLISNILSSGIQKVTHKSHKYDTTVTYTPLRWFILLIQAALFTLLVRFILH